MPLIDSVVRQVSFLINLLHILYKYLNGRRECKTQCSLDENKDKKDYAQPKVKRDKTEDTLR